MIRSFVWLADYHPIVQVDQNGLSIHPPTGSWVASLLTIINKAAVRIRVPVFGETYVFLLEACATRRGIAGACGDSVSDFFEEPPTGFPRWLCQSMFLSLHVLTPTCHLTFSMAVLVGAKGPLLAVMICVSLVASNAEHLFMRLLAIRWRFFPVDVSVHIHCSFFRSGCLLSGCPANAF